jgi:ElaB/YqjD/DUF883 family membrane-anchored ribosome-binding protein
VPKIRRVGPAARARLKTGGSDARAPFRKAIANRDGDRTLEQDTEGPEVEMSGHRRAHAAQSLGQALQAQIGQAVQPVLGDLQRQIAEAVRQQMAQALRLTRQEMEQSVDQALEPIQQVQGHVDQTVDRSPPEEQPLREALQRTAMALRELVQDLANTLRGLLQTVRSLLQAVVSLLLLILVALREGLMAALRTLGEGVGSVAERAVEAIRS